MALKIERVELLMLRLPYVHFFETSLGREHERTFILVRGFSEGLCGYGEVVAERAPFYSYETTETAWTVLKDFLIPLVLGSRVEGPADFYERARIYRGHPMAKAGLESALWDLEAKKKEVPLWKLYGGTYREVPSGVSVGIQDSVPELLQRIQEFLEQGYRRVKIKIKPGWDVSVCQEVRKAFPDIPLQVDANGAYTIDEKDRLKALDRFGLLMIEQPFSPPDLWDHSRLQKELQTPLCLNESITSTEVTRAALEMGSCRIVNIKPGRVGGIAESRKIHDLCQSRSVPVWCGGMLESGIGRAHNLHLAALANFRLPHDLSASERYYAEDLIEPSIRLTPRGTIPVPDGKGIGVHPVEERIQRATLRREMFRAS
ncbi:MAG: o-succinylbenzoate synthase [Candidatus Aminicenantales bacterium]